MHIAITLVPTKFPFMKVLSFVLLVFLPFIINAQDFNIEYKTYLLQSYFKEAHVKEMTVQSSEDSLFSNRKMAYRLQFDPLGRLVKVLDYYFDTDTIPERIIFYEYENDEPFYTAKKYHYIDGKTNRVLEKEWEIKKDLVNGTQTEAYYNGSEKYRTNNLIFNKALQLLSRKVAVFVVQLDTYFKYNKEGQLLHVKLMKNNPTVAKMKRLELNHYLEYNLNSKVMTAEQWVGERDKQINEYYYIYKGHQINSKVGWSLINWSNGDKKRIERTNFKYNENGLLVLADYFTERQVSNAHKYTRLDYEFYEPLGSEKVTSDQFTKLWFTDIFAENLIHP